MALNLVGQEALQAVIGKVEADYQKKEEVATYSIAKKETAESGYAATYNLTKDGEVVGASINIPKDYLVKSASIQKATEADQPVTGYKAGDKYLDFVVNAADGAGNESHIYILVQELVDVYTSGNGITIGADNKVSVKVDAANANGLTAGANGLSMALATEEAAGAMSAADKQRLGKAITDGDIHIVTADEAISMFTTTGA